MKWQILEITKILTLLDRNATTNEHTWDKEKYRKPQQRNGKPQQWN